MSVIVYSSVAAARAAAARALSAPSLAPAAAASQASLMAAPVAIREDAVDAARSKLREIFEAVEREDRAGDPEQQAES